IMATHFVQSQAKINEDLVNPTWAGGPSNQTSHYSPQEAVARKQAFTLRKGTIIYADPRQDTIYWTGWGTKNLRWEFNPRVLAIFDNEAGMQSSDKALCCPRLRSRHRRFESASSSLILPTSSSGVRYVSISVPISYKWARS